MGTGQLVTAAAGIVGGLLNKQPDTITTRELLGLAVGDSIGGLGEKLELIGYGKFHPQIWRKPSFYPKEGEDPWAVLMFAGSGVSAILVHKAGNVWYSFVGFSPMENEEAGLVRGHSIKFSGEPYRQGAGMEEYPPFAIRGQLVQPVDVGYLQFQFVEGVFRHPEAGETLVTDDEHIQFMLAQLADAQGDEDNGFVLALNWLRGIDWFWAGERLGMVIELGN